MAKNLTITIPDELHSRLEKVRDKIKLAKVCQKAIEKEVIVQELLKETEKGIDRLTNQFDVSREFVIKIFKELK